MATDTTAPKELACDARQIPEGFSSVTEGQATILQQGNSVFYNKAQVVNRDVSMAVLRWFVKQKAEETSRPKRAARPPPRPEHSPLKADIKGISILEGLAASGLRAIRYAKEVEGIGQVVANDMDADAATSMQRNIDFNGVSEKVTTSQSDARMMMLQHSLTFDVVDLDPYGSPHELLDTGVQAVADGGLLMVTATDMAVLCGNNAETCFTKYGSYSLHKEYHHEQALRILVASIAQHAARHKRVIEPVMCLYIDFYVRVFVRVRLSAADVKFTASKLSYVWQSTGCDSWWLQPLGSATEKASSTKFAVGKGPAVPQSCPISSGKFSMGGPIWHGPLHQPDAVKSMYSNIKGNSAQYPSHEKLSGILRAVQEELVDVPLYYTISGLSKTVKATSPKMATLRNAIVNAGFRASNTHCNPGGLKTDAPPEIIWDIMRCWVKKNAVRIKDADSYQAKILAKQPEHQANFASATGVISQAKAQNEPRFVQNPENWGPRPKHGRPMLKHELEEAEAEQNEAKKQKTA